MTIYNFINTINVLYNLLQSKITPLIFNISYYGIILGSKLNVYYLKFNKKTTLLYNNIISCLEKYNLIKPEANEYIEIIYNNNVINKSSIINGLSDINKFDNPNISDFHNNLIKYDFIIYTNKIDEHTYIKKIYHDFTPILENDAFLYNITNNNFMLIECDIYNNYGENFKLDIDLKINSHNFYITGNNFNYNVFKYIFNKYYNISNVDKYTLKLSSLNLNNGELNVNNITEDHHLIIDETTHCYKLKNEINNNIKTTNDETKK
jgi:hypothetical protein